MISRSTALQSLAQHRSNSFTSATLAKCSPNAVAQLILELAQICVFGDYLGSQTLCCLELALWHEEVE